MTTWVRASEIRLPPEGHVHSRACDRVAQVTFLGPDGEAHVWPVSAWCTDDEASVHRHFKRWVPSGTWVGVTFETT